ncbi:MAG TPA: THUMP domain-containing protein [Steroidobacteraceae bacterium]|nr:THUMP domain-containing protein [Steroidobacteraceae bacterium]
MQLIATCPEETKPALVLELESLGAREIVPGYRAVAFEASVALFYELHLKLRTASRILKVIKQVPSRSPAMLRSQVRRIRWDELFDVRHGFMIESQGEDAEKGGMAPKQIITQVREGIREVFERGRGIAPAVDRAEPRVAVVAHLRHGRCTLSFDTSGKSLHKRGYREPGHPAPLKETLSAAILTMAGYDGSQAFMDPMCGSGTIAIEAAMMALHKAPQIHRKKGEFFFEWLRDFDRNLWRATQERVRAEKLEALIAPVVASDINAAYVAMAKKSALDARVERYMSFKTGRFQDAEPPAPTGILVTNLPYGERIDSREGDIVKLYEEVGDTLKRKFSGWQAAILAAAASPYKAIGLKPRRTIALMNGSIPCKLLLFELYTGTRQRRHVPGGGAA